jgi:TPR repeat protein
MRRYLVSIVAIIPLAFSSAVTAGDYQDGRDAYDVGNFDKAMAVWAPAAESGDADSQYGMGLLYSEGIAVPMDDLQALKWFGLAAEQGHGEAQYKLGVMHANGWGVPMSEVEAMKSWRNACRLKSSPRQMPRSMPGSTITRRCWRKAASATPFAQRTATRRP